MVDLPYLEQFGSLSSSCGSSSGWRREENNSFVLNYDTYFIAEGTDGQVVVDYHNQLELHCSLDDIAKDAAEVVDIKEQANLTMKAFLEEQTKSFFHLLRFPEVYFSDELKESETVSVKQMQITYEIRAINRIMASTAWEEMSDEQKALAKAQHQVRFIEKRSN